MSSLWLDGRLEILITVRQEQRAESTLQSTSVLAELMDERKGQNVLETEQWKNDCDSRTVIRTH